YTRRPSRELAILGGLVTGGIVLVHGSELYTALVGLVVISIAAWRGLRWRLLGAHLGLAFIVAVALSGAYLPALVGWAGAGGPGDAALAEFGTRTQAANRPIDDEALFWLNTFTAGIVVDTPVRVALLVAGIWLGFR